MSELQKGDRVLCVEYGKFELGTILASDREDISPLPGDGPIGYWVETESDRNSDSDLASWFFEYDSKHRRRPSRYIVKISER